MDGWTDGGEWDSDSESSEDDWTIQLSFVGWGKKWERTSKNRVKMQFSIQIKSFSASSPRCVRLFALLWLIQLQLRPRWPCTKERAQALAFQIAQIEGHARVIFYPAHRMLWCRVIALHCSVLLACLLLGIPLLQRDRGRTRLNTVVHARGRNVIRQYGDVSVEQRSLHDACSGMQVSDQKRANQNKKKSNASCRSPQVL